MKRILLSLAVLSAAFSVHAADMTGPVNEIMQEAVKGWAEDSQEGEDYFSQDRLDRLYSQDFARVYRAAAKFPAYEDGDSPFDYDVIVSGQDSCTIKDLAVSPGAETDGKSDVKVTFDNTHCFGERPADWKPAELHFMMIEENGHPVIDDIIRDSDQGSVKAELQDIVTQGAANP